MKHDDYAIVLLAAGASSRMGESKQLLPLHGMTVLARATHVAVESSIPNVVVVLGAEHERHRNEVEALNVHVVVNHDWKTGMGSSLTCGLNAVIEKWKTIKGALVMVCDQPAVTSAHLNLLVEAHLGTGKDIVASRYAGSMGVPAFFSEVFFQALLSMPPESGAKAIIRQHLRDVELVDLSKGEIDLDTPEEYQNYIQHHP